MISGSDSDSDFVEAKAGRVTAVRPRASAMKKGAGSSAVTASQRGPASQRAAALQRAAASRRAALSLRAAASQRAGAVQPAPAPAPQLVSASKHSGQGARDGFSGTPPGAKASQRVSASKKSGDVPRRASALSPVATPVAPQQLHSSGA